MFYSWKRWRALGCLWLIFVKDPLVPERERDNRLRIEMQGVGSTQLSLKVDVPFQHACACLGSRGWIA